MGTVPSSLFGHHVKTTTVQPICIDQNSGEIHKLREDQPIAIRRRLNSALDSVGGKLRSAASIASRRRTGSSNSTRRASTSLQQKIEQNVQINNSQIYLSNTEKQPFKFCLKDLENPNECKNLNKKIKENKEEDNNFPIFKKFSNSKEENLFNLFSSDSSEQTILERHKKEENEYYLLSSANYLSQKENKCDDNNDVQILINVKNEENKFNNSSPISDIFYIEKKKTNQETQLSNKPSTSSSPPKLSPLRNRLLTSPILENKKIIIKQQCKANFKSARGIKKEEIPSSFLIDLDSICLDDQNLLIGNKKEENTKIEEELLIPSSSFNNNI